MSKIVSVAIDEETFVRLEQAMQVEAAKLGVGEITRSVFLRGVLLRGLDSPASLFDQGFLEGYRAGFTAVLRHFQKTIGEVIADPTRVLGMRDVGVTNESEGG